VRTWLGALSCASVVFLPRSSAALHAMSDIDDDQILDEGELRANAQTF
jgi:hypothetical protein